MNHLYSSVLDKGCVPKELTDKNIAFNYSEIKAGENHLDMKVSHSDILTMLKTNVL